jgi:hypothetical protein
MDRTPTAAGPGDAGDRPPRGLRRRPALLIGGGVLIAVLAVALCVLPRLLRSTSAGGKTYIEFSRANASDLDAALVVTSEDTGEQRVLWMTHGELSNPYRLERFPGRLRLAVVTSDLDTGPVTTGSCDLTVPMTGIATIEVEDDNTATVIMPEQRIGGPGALPKIETDRTWESLVAASSGKAPVLTRNGSSRHARLTLVADDGVSKGNVWYGNWQSFSFSKPSRAWIPGEHLHATWELAAPVTSGGIPFRVSEPGDLDLQVNVFPDGRWEIGESHLIDSARIRFASLWGKP